MRIAVLGAGAMGSLFGGLLAAAGEDVTLVTRNAEHVAAINERGLRIVDAVGADTTSVSADTTSASVDTSSTSADSASDERIVSVPATADPTTVGTVDLVLVFVKSDATAEAMADAESLFGPETDVLTLQNGLGNAEAITEFVPARRVLVGVTTHGAMRPAPGLVAHTGRGDTALGRWRGTVDDRATAVATRLTAAGVPTDVVDDPEWLVWEKVLVNVGINAPTALARVENGTLARTAPGRRLLRTAVNEARAVARAHGHDVRADAVEYAIDVAERTASNRSSMRVDLESGRRTEVEAVYGAVLDRAEAADVDVPVVRTLADLIRLATCERPAD